MSLMRSIRPVLAGFLSLSLFFPCVSSGRAIGLPRGDVIPPEIRHTPLTEFSAGIPLRIQATVTDNVRVSDVTLIYRGAGDSEYRRVKMLEAPGSDIYTVDLPDTAGPRIEYFIQAIDQDGNAMPDQLRDPYVITVPAMTAMKIDRGQAPAAMAERVPEKEGISKWVWIGLGAVAVAALAGGGSSGGGDSNNTGNTGTSGTVIISAPVPVP